MKILITGATDGIGLEAAKLFVQKQDLGIELLIHGRSSEKLDAARNLLLSLNPKANVSVYQADLSSMSETRNFAKSVLDSHNHIDVLINNAGILQTSDTRTKDGFDVRFAVNTFAPFVLTHSLLPIIKDNGRIVNLSSAAQSPIDESFLLGRSQTSDSMQAYAQSKLAITMWSRALADQLGGQGPSVIALNPGSLLASKMVKQGFGIAGNDMSIGAEIIVRSALDETFAAKSGQYFDNDISDFGPPHVDAQDNEACAKLYQLLEDLLIG